MKPGKTSKQIFEDSGLHDVCETSPNRITFSKGYTKVFLASLGIKGDSLMDWPVCVFARFESYIKLLVHVETTYIHRWKKDAAASVPPSQIRKLTQSINDRRFEVIM